MEPILAFDCATSPASVALRVGDRVVAESIAHGSQAAQLVPVIDRLLRENGVHYNALGSIVTTIGPGSFTGLRIALATLHGLVLAHAVPVRLLTSSAAVAWAITLRVDAPPRFVIALDAGKGEVFVQECMRGQGTPPFTPSRPLQDFIPPAWGGLGGKKIQTNISLPPPASPASGGDGARWFLSPMRTEPAAMISATSLPCFSNLHAPDHPQYISGPDAAVLARIAENIAIRPLADAVPYYIRPADAKIAS